MRTLVLSLIALFGCESALAMRCGNALVTEGMNRAQVRHRCGEPDDRSRRFETIYRRVNRDETVAREIEIEEWFYQGNSRTLDRRVIFIDGYMAREEVPDTGGIGS